MKPRLNVGCGRYPLLGWMNLDSSSEALADVYQSATPLQFPDEWFSEIFAGHFLEHLTREDGLQFLKDAYRCLEPGGKLGIVVPDTKAVMCAWLNRIGRTVEYPEGVFNAIDDLDAVCHLFLYSTAQESNHLWSYDRDTLARILTEAGFRVTKEIDRMSDPRITVGAWYQVGLEAVKEC